MPEQEYLIVEHLSLSEITYFFSRIHINVEKGCWEFQGAPNTYGYCQVDFRGRFELVHRIMYAWAIGPIPRGSSRLIPQLDHLVCDNRPCCNPSHLILTSLRDNNVRSASMGGVNARKTHCIHGHPLPSEPNRPPERKRPHILGRTCLTCRTIQSRRGYLKRLPEGPHKESVKKYYEDNPVG